MAAIMSRLAQTGSFWSDAISTSDWHFSPDRLEEIKVGHLDLGCLEDLISMADCGTEKSLETSMAHATDSDRESHAIKRGIRELSASVGYPAGMVYSTVNDLFGRTHEIVPVLGAHLGLTSCYIKLHRQDPGQVWPLHVDNYHAFRGEGRVDNNSGIRRFIFALNDWCWGQMFQLGNSIWSNWRAGDFIEITPGVPHSSANASPLARYSLVITGRRPE